VLTWGALVAALLTVSVGVRWALTRVDTLGRSRPFPVVSVAVLALGAVALATPGVLRVRLEHRLSAVTTVLAGVPTTVHCQSFGQSMVDAGNELGFVRWGANGTPEHATLIKRDQCNDLNAYLRSNHRTPTEQQVVAVHVLTHEAMHMAGLTAESAAECAAVHKDARTAELLGATPEEARALADRYWRTVYPRLTDEYRSAACTPPA
jgi:hypothetical protein